MQVSSNKRSSFSLKNKPRPAQVDAPLKFLENVKDTVFKLFSNWKHEISIFRKKKWKNLESLIVPKEGPPAWKITLSPAEINNENMRVLFDQMKVSGENAEPKKSLNKVWQSIYNETAVRLSWKNE